jgi:glycine hydroxymethyltransferase
MNHLDSGFPAHDPDVLRTAAAALDACVDAAAMQDLVLAKVHADAEWRGRQCLNLVAAEGPPSPLVRQLLSAEVGGRASGGHIGRAQRVFSAMPVIDDLEALCVELLKRLFRCEFADARPLSGMHACMIVYTALARPGDIVMTVGLSGGGNSSHTVDGPPGVRGLTIVDIPVDASRLAIDLDRFAQLARVYRPAVIGVGQSISLFPMPIQQMRQIVAEWGGQVYVDAAHEAGLIAGAAFPDPLQAGARVVSGSSGKTFCGPQGGFILWDDPTLTPAMSHTIFPVLTGSHQLNRVAALAVAATEALAYGEIFMKQVVDNARTLARALHERGLDVLYADLGYTATHQVIVDVRRHDGGYRVASRLAEANLVVNKQALPSGDGRERSTPGAIRLGTVEVTRLGMAAAEMIQIADLIVRALDRGVDLSRLRQEVVCFRRTYQTIFYCHATGVPQPARIGYEP